MTFVEQTISDENVFVLLKRSIASKLEKIEEQCVVYIQKHAKKIMDDTKFLELNLNTVMFILKFDKLNCKEIELFHFVIKWALAFCDRHNKELDSLKSLFDFLL